MKYPTLMLRIQCGLPVSSAIASTPQAEYWSYIASGGLNRPCVPYSHSTHYTVRAAALLPKADIFKRQSPMDLQNTSQLRFMIPQLHSFCGKRMTATVTCLSERLGGLNTNIIVSILQQLSKLADRDSSHAALLGQTWEESGRS